MSSSETCLTRPEKKKLLPAPGSILTPSSCVLAAHAFVTATRNKLSGTEDRMIAARRESKVVVFIRGSILFLGRSLWNIEAGNNRGARLDVGYADQTPALVGLAGRKWLETSTRGGVCRLKKRSALYVRHSFPIDGPSIAQRGDGSPATERKHA